VCDEKIPFQSSIKGNIYNNITIIGGGLGNPFNQILNTTSNVTFDVGKFSDIYSYEVAGIKYGRFYHDGTNLVISNLGGLIYLENNVEIDGNLLAVTIQGDSFTDGIFSVTNGEFTDISKLTIGHFPDARMDITGTTISNRFGEISLDNNNLTTTGNITANYFKGDGSLLTGISGGTTYYSDNVWINKNSTDGFNFNATQLETTYINASVNYTIRGTPAGTIQNLQIYDSIPYNVTEVAGAIGLDFRINFTGVTSFNQLKVRYKSSVAESHTMYMQIYDTELGTWENYYTLGAVADYANLGFAIDDEADHIINGVVQVRFYQADNGNTNHIHYFDWVVLTHGFISAGSQEIDPYCWHRSPNGETGNFATTGNVSASNISVSNNLIVAGNVRGREFTFTNWSKITGTDDSYGRMLSVEKTNYDLSSGNTKQSFTISAFGSTGGSRVMLGSIYDMRYTGTASQTGSIEAINGQIYHTGTGNTANSYAMFFDLYKATHANVTAFYGAYTRGTSVVGYNGSIFTYYGHYDAGLAHNSKDNSTDAFNFYGSAHSGNISNAYGLYLAKQTAGLVSNQGIYLAGDYQGSDIVFGTHKDASVFWNDTNSSLQITNDLRVDGNIYYDGATYSYSPTIFCSAEDDACMTIDFKSRTTIWCSQSTGKCDSEDKEANKRVEEKLAKIKAKAIEQANFQAFTKSCEQEGKEANSLTLWKNKPECVEKEIIIDEPKLDLAPIENDKTEM
jgi:hypothetical protein